VRAPDLDPERDGSKASEITVPDTLHGPHRAIAAWIRHERQVAADRRDRSTWGTAWETNSFPPPERRRQRFLSTLFKEAEKLGYRVKGEAPYTVEQLMIVVQNACSYCGEPGWSRPFEPSI
jgi:hypothetical protein